MCFIPCAAKDLFDECRASEECAAVNPYLRCVNHLCVCASPYVLHDRDQCRPGTPPMANNLQQWASWLVPIVVVVALIGHSVACFRSGGTTTRQQRLSAHHQASTMLTPTHTLYFPIAWSSPRGAA
ncbi:hypothetical protein HPB52_025557 [Rhipicephalus sanguineus]|uniref:EB domain-containing protein n=1 Tax=Rhipicephalus sanguineus TaxID=34632 RepID=A0A9D4YRC6_RHISA|nr:hypothetical protein HPB52_025557 [Rhipicephalus sanguineus]